MGILAVHITTAKIREAPVNEASLGHLGHPGQIGVGWVPQNDVTMEQCEPLIIFNLPYYGKLRIFPNSVTTQSSREHSLAISLKAVWTRLPR